MSSYTRVQEFVAHSKKVNCVAIGNKSCQVLATGGEDWKVNVWRVGSVENIWTLGDNKAAIECLCFDNDENYVLSGALNGSIKVFDLSAGKVARQFNGHQVGVTSMHYHPSDTGHFLVSGSADCTMKFWDVRNKACVDTFSGHKKEITSVRFSPDGKWVASASKDGLLIFYDLVASKHIQTIKISPAYATAFEFNPCDMSLIASTSTRNVRAWDLDSFQQISALPSESMLVGAVAFPDSGLDLYTTTKTGFKMWDVESLFTLKDHIDVGWNSISGMRVTDGSQVIAAGYNSNFVSVWQVDVNQYLEAKQETLQQQMDEQSSVANQRGMFSEPVVRRPSVESAPPPVVAVPKPTSRVTSVNYDKAEPGSKGSAKGGPVDRVSPPMDREVADEKPGPPPQVMPSGDRTSFINMAASLDESFWNRLNKQKQEEAAQALLKDLGDDDDDHVSYADERLEVPHDELDSLVDLGNLLPPAQYDNKQTPVAQQPSARQQQQAKGLPDVPSKAAAAAGGGGPSSYVTNRKTPSARDAQPSYESREADVQANNDRRKPAIPVTVVAPVAGGGQRGGMRYAYSDNEEKGGADIDLMAAAGKAIRLQSPQPVNNAHHSDMKRDDSSAAVGNEVSRCHELADKMMISSSSASSTLSQRLATLRLLRQTWNKGDVMSVLETLDVLKGAMMMDNPQNLSIIVDFLLGVELKGQLLSLDACMELLPIIDAAVSYSSSRSPQVETNIFATYRAYISLAQSFGELIRNTRSIMVAGGVDISREERLNKCNTCYEYFSKAKQRTEVLRYKHRSSAGVVQLLDQYNRLANNYFV